MRHGQAFALLGGLDRVGLHALALDPFNHGSARYGGHQRRYAQLCRLANQKIQWRALHRREYQPQIGFRCLWAKLDIHRQGSRLLADRGNPRQPFAVSSIEQRHRITRRQTQNMGQVMGLIPAAFRRHAACKITFDEQPCPRPVSHVGYFRLGLKIILRRLSRGTRSVKISP